MADPARERVRIVRRGWRPRAPASARRLRARRGRMTDRTRAAPVLAQENAPSIRVEGALPRVVRMVDGRVFKDDAGHRSGLSSVPAIEAEAAKADDPTEAPTSDGAG